MTAKMRLAALAACCGLVSAFGGAAQAQTSYSEVEPNEAKTTATTVGGAGGMVAGDTITGNTTGTSTTTAGAASADYFRVKTAAAPLGIYRYDLTLTTGGTAGHTGTIRGLTVTGGVANAGTDAELQLSNTTSVPARVNRWFGFGKQEELYYRVTGGTTTTANYVATLTRTPVTPIAIPGVIPPGSITIVPDAATQTAYDTDFFVYDSNFNVIGGADDPDTVGVTLNLPPGTYYIAAGNYNTATNFTAIAGTFLTGIATDFPNVLASSSSGTGTVPWGVELRTGSITGAILATGVGTARTAASPFNPDWFTFTVAIPTGPTPTTCAASPASIDFGLGGSVTISTTVVPGTGSATISSVRANLSAFGLSANTPLSNGGSGTTYTGTFSVASSQTAGVYPITITATDGAGATGQCTASFTVVPPFNDTCASAINIASLPYTSLPINLFQATIDQDVSCNSGTAGTNNGVWFTYTPAANGSLALNNTTGPDTVTTIFTGDCSSLIEVACSDPSSFNYPNAIGGTTYYILVGVWSSAATTTNPNNLVFTLNPIVLGACCNNTSGVCSSTTAAGCSATTSSYQGDNTVCSPSPCPPQGSCCNPATGTCTITIQTACVSTSVWTSGFSSCTPNPCPPPPPPSNDTCAGALNITSLPYTSPTINLFPATLDQDVSCNSTAAFGTNNGVWFTYTPAANVNLALNNTTGPDTVTVIFTGDCSSLAEVACSDPSSFTYSNAVGGTTYYILVGLWSSAATTTNPNNLVFTLNPIILGACCNNTTGACTSTTSAACSTTTSSYQGDNTVCSPSPCPPQGSCCNPATGTCTITIQTACVSTSVWTSGFSSCTPNPCPQPPPPSNDECATAQTITGTGLFTFTNIFATTTTLNDQIPGCVGSTTPLAMNNDVWFRWVAPATGNFSHILRTAGGGLVAPSVRAAVYDGGTGAGTCPISGGAPISCSIVPGLVTADVVAGNVYYVQVASTTAGTTGAGQMEFNLVATTTGSCCVGSACTVTSDTECAAQSGTYGGGSTLCAPATAVVNSYNGAGGSITDFVSPNPSVFSSPITVSDSFTVAGVEVDVTMAHTWVGDLIISLSNGSRTVVLSNRAKRGVLVGAATTPSIVGSSSNIGTGTTTGTALYTFSDAGTSDFFTESTDSSTFNLVASPGIIYRPATTGDLNNRFTDAFNGQPATGTWTLTITDSAGGDTGNVTGWSLRLTQGTPISCAPSTVICCRGTTCAVIRPAACTAPAGIGIRTVTGSSCAGQSAINAGCCYADFNKSGVKDVADIFAYLSAWFANSSFADVGGDGTGTRDVSDIFQFLSAWFAGCT